MASLQPKMAAPFFTKVDHSCVAAVGLTDRKIETFFCIGYENEMYMIWHEAISPSLDMIFKAPS